ncbi:hypothetical protein G6F24_016732 [Rhizopus arrhizus]|nr:hypothetical protein G6F24_016732 [Rhizopus arrhizus]
MEARAKFMQTLLAQPGMAQYDWKLLDRAEVADLVPGIGPEVRGATWTPVDGIANPLKLLRALHMSFAQRVVDYLPRRPARSIKQRDGVFDIDTPAGTVRGPGCAGAPAARPDRGAGTHAPHAGDTAVHPTPNRRGYVADL